MGYDDKFDFDATDSALDGHQYRRFAARKCVSFLSGITRPITGFPLAKSIGAGTGPNRNIGVGEVSNSDTPAIPKRHGDRAIVVLAEHGFNSGRIAVNHGTHS